MELRLRPSFVGIFTALILTFIMTLIFYFFFRYQISDAILTSSIMAIIIAVTGVKPQYKMKTESIVKKVCLFILGMTSVTLVIIFTGLVCILLAGNDPYFALNAVIDLDTRLLAGILIFVVIALSSVAIRNFQKL